MSEANEQVSTPRTLIEAVRYFSDLEVATQFVARLRWKDGPVCPACGHKEHSYLKTRRLWKCKNRECRKQFSVKVGTIFEDSPIGLDKWIVAAWMIANCKNGVSSHELGRALGVTQKTAWFMLHRVRLAMQSGTFAKLMGEVEADETYIGGAARFMHADRRAKLAGRRGRASSNKTPVVAVKERGGEIRAEVIPNVSKTYLHRHVRRHVAPGASLYTDAFRSYNGLGDEYDHQTVDHAERYVDGQVHTNGVENFWSLLKRGLKGTYIHVEPFHLFRYLDEQVFRYNGREGNDADRFVAVLGRIAGRRVTWRELTGKA